MWVCGARSPTGVRDVRRNTFPPHHHQSKILNTPLCYCSTTCAIVPNHLLQQADLTSPTLFLIIATWLKKPENFYKKNIFREIFYRENTNNFTNQMRPFIYFASDATWFGMRPLTNWHPCTRRFSGFSRNWCTHVICIILSTRI